MEHRHRHRGTRIVATLGPASSSEEGIEKLFRAGADVFRINMSHGERADKAGLVHMIRAVEKKVGRPIGIMVDLQGPKIRVGQMPDGGAELKAGSAFHLDMNPEAGSAFRAPLPHPEIFAALGKGTDILLDDGRIHLRVNAVKGDSAVTTVIAGGILKTKKGVNVPNAVLPVSAMTGKDRADLEFMIEHDIDWVALSFVQRPEDVAELKKLVAGRAGCLAKIEKPAAVERLDEILDFADAVMVARGDLGVECPPEDVPQMQRRIISAAREKGKAVVVATQMLESMITSPVPTRAEVSDVATAVYEGADAVMLSAESAVGPYGPDAVAIMDKVAQRVERDPIYKKGRDDERMDPNATTEDAISGAARHVAQNVRATAIVTFTKTGSTAIRAAQKRPEQLILVLTPKQETARRLCLYWGLHTVRTRDVSSFEEMIGKSKRMAIRQGLAKAGDRIVVTAGVPFGTPGATNVLHVAWIHGNEV